jgi:hypothetical protein
MSIRWESSRGLRPQKKGKSYNTLHKNIMVDHDDFWNPEIVRLIGISFADAYEQRQTLRGQPVP